MALTLPSNWDEILARPHKATWLFELYYDSTNYVGLSFEDIDYLGTPFYGAVLNKPSIRDALNLAQSKASTSNISLTVANFTYNGADFSEELFGGTNKYINKDCRIYLYLEDVPADTWDTLTTNWEDEHRDWDAIGARMQIYQGRITSMSHTADKIKINIVTKRPWDFLSIPNQQTNTKKVYEPIAYGDFTGNTKSGYYLTDLTSKSLYPLPMINSQYSSTKRFSTGDLTAAISTYYPEYYDSDQDAFFPMTDPATTTAEGTNIVTVNGNLKRTAIMRPISDAIHDPSLETTWANPGNAYDTDTASYAEASWTDVTTSDDVEHLFTFPENFAGDSSGSGTVSFVWETSNTSTGVGTIGLEYSTDGSSYTSVSSVTAGNSDSGTTGSISISTPFGSKFYIKSKLTYTSGAITGHTRVKDIYMSVDIINGDDDIQFAYFGEDGFAKSYTDGSGTATLIHEAHRDILKRYVGIDAADADITGWSDLNTARSGWNLRYWLLEPEEIKKILEKLQFEGAFAFWFRADDTMKYFYLKTLEDVQDSEDHLLTKNDVSDLSISHTNFSGLITKWELKSEKHPADNRYMTSASVANSASRTSWNITEAKEGVKEVKFDALSAKVNVHASDPTNDETNDSWVGYMDAIVGDVNLTISGKALNPKFAASMEIGDVIRFSSAPTAKFFGKSISGKYFVITSTQRNPAETNFKAYEIRK